MPEKQEPDPKNGKLFTKIGIFGTSIWLICAVTYSACNFTKITGLEPNALGDALAGAFAPLAFLWLVLGYFQQGVELRNSGQALWLQGQELKNSVEQQRELVSVTREQLTFESDYRKSEEAEKHRVAQPIIKIKTANSRIANNIMYQSFNITNHGKTCTNVSIYKANKLLVDFNLFETGETRHITLDFVIDHPYESFIKIVYMDTLMKLGDFLYSLNWKNNNISVELLYDE